MIICSAACVKQMIENRRGNALFWDVALISSERLRLIFQRHPEAWGLSPSSTRVPVRNDQGATLIWRGSDKPDDWGEKGHSRYNTDATRGRREGEGREGSGREGRSQHPDRNARATILARWYRQMIGTWKSFDNFTSGISRRIDTLRFWQSSLIVVRKEWAN